MQTGEKGANNSQLQASEDKSAVSTLQDSPSKANRGESSNITVNIDAYSEYIE